jgi:hypothetical protein
MSKISRTVRGGEEVVRNVRKGCRTLDEEGEEDDHEGRVEEKQLVWYGHLQRMSEERWPKKIWEWTPLGRRRRGRP